MSRHEGILSKIDSLKQQQAEVQESIKQYAEQNTDVIRQIQALQGMNNAENRELSNSLDQLNGQLAFLYEYYQSQVANSEELLGLQRDFERRLQSNMELSSLEASRQQLRPSTTPAQGFFSFQNKRNSYQPSESREQANYAQTSLVSPARLIDDDLAAEQRPQLASLPTQPDLLAYSGLTQQKGGYDEQQSDNPFKQR